MDRPHERTAGYVVPSYRAGDAAAWYHFLHGNVPGHQIDFIYRPEVPQGPLTRQHFSHLSRLMKYIEPQSNERFAFAIGNLSRDDTQYEPAHGGVAILFALRIRGAVDHAGRQDPPFAHAIAAIDRALDYPTLIESALAFHRHVLGAAESAEWYRAYVRGALSDPGAVRGVLDGYVERFGDLPEPPESAMTPAWVTGGAPQPRRIVLAHEDDVAFRRVAGAAARVAAVLYRSDIRWTVISNGREDDVPNGVSIRLLAHRELGPADATAVVHDLADLPDDEAGIAALLFGATPAGAPEEKRARGWREQYSEQEAPGSELDAGRASHPPAAHRSVHGAMREQAPAIPAPARRVPSSVRPPPPPALWDEPSDDDRTALMEVPTPVAPWMPAPPESPFSSAVTEAAPLVKVSAAAPPGPAAVTAPPRKPEPERSRLTLWLSLSGLGVAVIALIVVLVSTAGTPAASRSATPASAATPPAPATAAAPQPPAPVPAPPAVSTPAPAPLPPASAAAPPPRASSPVPSGAASALQPIKRRPKNPKPTVFGGSLD